MATTSQPAAIRRLIRVRGVVQGVGFRPYVYQLAHRLQLTGYVLNSSSGVTIEIEGPESVLDLFASELLRSPPALAHIESVHSEEVAVGGDDRFRIRESTSTVGEFVLVSPDVATCPQ